VVKVTSLAVMTATWFSTSKNIPLDAGHWLLSLLNTKDSVNCVRTEINGPNGYTYIFEQIPDALSYIVYVKTDGGTKMLDFQRWLELWNQSTSSTSELGLSVVTDPSVQEALKITAANIGILF
jgi:hypothetical protein